jgi:hypothetical protein
MSVSLIAKFSLHSALVAQYTAGDTNLETRLQKQNISEDDVFWDVAPYILVEVYRRFRGACCRNNHSDQTLMMEAVSTSETSVNF